MKTKIILLALIIGFPVVSFAQLSVITTYNRADTAVQVQFNNNPVRCSENNAASDVWHSVPLCQS